MLTELRIRNFAVIEEAAVTFGPGLNVLSGETGAGKTIIMTALGLLIGGRASPDLIRAGAKEAVVEGIFEFEGEAPPPGAAEWLNEDNPRELLVRRVIAESGRARVSINDNLATVQALARIGDALVQIYGQHEQQALLQRDNHLAILDRHASLETAATEYRELYDEIQTLDAQRAELAQRERERADRLEIARFRLNELERANLTPGEDAQLAEERLVVANAAKLAEAVDVVEQMLYAAEGAAVDAVGKAGARLADAAALDPRLKEPLELILAARTNLEEAAHALRAYAARIEADPARLEQLETRLNELTRLKRKYGGTIEAALELLERSRNEIAELEALSESRAEIEAKRDRLIAALADRARRLSAIRSSSGAQLARQMNAELKTLGMRSATFETRIAQLAGNAGSLSYDGSGLGPTGSDLIEFYLAPNLGQPPLPLMRIASGGELSRVMLALKRLEARRRGVATLIFDEVDAGIGGAVAEIVGRKLKQLARFHQILCVTHLAQIAAFGDSHFVVEKEERRGATRSRVTTLASNDRPAEIARMLGGDETNEKFLRAAHELIDRSTQ
jgi:DNA repair protein RecN (Recombination protein N)